MLFNLLSLTLSLTYSYLIFWIYRGYKANLSDKISVTSIPNCYATVIIPVRNEEAHIRACIQSILDNDFPIDQYEIIIIDDHSSDKTKSIVEQFQENNIRYLSLPKQIYGKKQAITYGLEHARFPIILSTDGDCIVGKGWITTHLTHYLRPQTQITTGTVLPKSENTLLAQFQWLDFTSMMTVTANGIYRKSYHLGNAANLSYLKSAFIAHKGFEGNLDRASGDDIYLIQKMAKSNAGSIAFNSAKEAIVYTKSEATWMDFFIQRKRWASKAMNTFNSSVKWIQGFIFTYTLIMTLCILLAIISPDKFLKSCLLLWIVKLAVDFLFLRRLAKDYDNTNAIKWFLPSFLVYVVHILLSGYYALFPPTYQWKNRSLK